MEREKLEELFASIKEDNLKAFSSIMLSNSDLNIRFGRFPILSLLYLYNSSSILSKYEKLLLPIKKFEEVFEPFDAYKKFKLYAKKSLKLFSGEKIIQPIEMLAVVDNRSHLCKFYKLLHKNEEICSRLSKIYNLTHNLETVVNEEKIEISRKPLNLKQRLIASVICLAFVLASVFSLLSVLVVKSNSGLGTKNNPILISSAATLQTAAGSKGKYYKLTEDIELSEDFYAKNFTGVIDGNGHTIFADKFLVDGLFDELSGTIKNVTIYADYEDKSIYENFGIIAKKSSGNIENVIIKCAFSGKTFNDADVYVAGMVAINSGKISNCTVTLDATIKNERNSNAYISAIAGENSGEIFGCKSLGEKISADTVDIAGIVATNNGKVTDCVNEAELNQVSAKEWNPNVAGIVMTNNGDINTCKNTGKIISASTLEQNPDGKDYAVFSAGIVCENNSNIIKCENFGMVSGTTKVDSILIFVGGICAVNSAAVANSTALISKCVVEADLYCNSGVDDPTTEIKRECYVAGISASVTSIGQPLLFNVQISSFSRINNCSYVGKIKFDTDSVFAGGLVGWSYYGFIKDSYTKATFESSRVEDKGLNFYNSPICGAVRQNVTGLCENNYYVSTQSISNVDLKILIAYEARVLEDEGQINKVLSATKVSKIEDVPEEVRPWLVRLFIN